MKIPRVVIKNKQEYEFVKRNNATTFLYKNKKYGYKETFSLYQLGVLKQQIEPPKLTVHPENVKIWLRRYKWNLVKKNTKKLKVV